MLYHVRREGHRAGGGTKRAATPQIRDLVASFQRAVVTALVRRLKQAGRGAPAASLLLTGGVAANSLLRREAARAAEALGLPLFVPPIALSTDNAAMIGAAGFVAFSQGRARRAGT